MKRIVFDLTKTQPLLSHNSKFHGGGKYGIAVFRKLAEMAPERLIAYYNNELYISKELIHIISEKNIPVYFTKDLTILELAKREDCIVYTPFEDRSYFKDPSIPILFTLHDIRSLTLTSDKYMFSYNVNDKLYDKFMRKLESLFFYIYVKYKHKRALQKYGHFINSKQFRFVTVSDYSKYSILSYFPQVNPEDIKVFYSPSTICNEELSDKPKQYGKYWLIVSGNRWVKNSIRAIIAFDKLFSEHPNLKGNVVITGLQSLKDLKIHVNNKSRFICIGYVSERDFKSFYNYAYALVYPTLSEGFGYPPLEAMHEGCPIIASGVTSIPEVCGDAALYFNPCSIYEIKARIIQLEDERLRDYYAERGKSRQMLIEERQNKDLYEFCRYLLDCLNAKTL